MTPRDRQVKIFSIVLCLVAGLWFNSAEAATFRQAQNIYNRIIIDNSIFAPPLILNSSGEINADETAQRISVNIGLLRFVKNSSELAFVLGHELAHYTLHHHGSTITSEYAADYQGAIFMSNSGYNRCLGAQLFKRFPNVPVTDHPANADRLRHLGCS